jgi:hypothetical protein
VSDDLAVAEAADALGTSPQTVRRLLRDGELRGRRQPWGSRFVWVASRKGVCEFVSQHGRLDGRRRGRAATGVLRGGPDITAPGAPASPRPGPAHSRPVWRPWFLRPRGRAGVVVVVLGLPLLVVYASAQILPGALWFDELGQLDVFGRIAAAKAGLWLVVAGTAAPFVALNLFVALSRAGVARTRSVTLAVLAASVVGAISIAWSAARQWQTFLLWRHRQPFGVVDPMSGKDVGFFVFSLPFELLASRLLDAGLRTGQPRIYFGDLPPKSPGWVLVDTRRPEVDVPASGRGYHYTGPAGIPVSSGIERAVFALALREQGSPPLA